MDPRPSTACKIFCPVYLQDTIKINYIDMAKEAPLTGKSYLELMSEQFLKGLPFCLALVDDKRSKTLQNFSWDIIENKRKNPLTQQNITKIYYFILKNETPFQFNFIMKASPFHYDNLTLLSGNALIPALKGDQAGQFRLAQFLEKGIDELKSNKDEAKYWFKLAGKEDNDSVSTENSDSSSDYE